MCVYLRVPPSQHVPLGLCLFSVQAEAARAMTARKEAVAKVATAVRAHVVPPLPFFYSPNLCVYHPLSPIFLHFTFCFAV